MAWAELIELTIGFILAIAALSKLLRLASFRAAVRAYRIVPTGVAGVLPPFLVTSEAVVATLLLLRLAPLPALASASALFLGFAAAVAVQESGASDEQPARSDCGCLGGLVRLRLGRVSVFLNLVLALAAAAAAAAVAASGGNSLSVGMEGPLGGAVLWLCALLLALMYWLATYAVSVAILMDETLEGGGIS
jgi:hypothetical protein